MSIPEGRQESWDGAALAVLELLVDERPEVVVDALAHLPAVGLGDLPQDHH